MKKGLFFAYHPYEHHILVVGEWETFSPGGKYQHLLPKLASSLKSQILCLQFQKTIQNSYNVSNLLQISGRQNRTRKTKNIRKIFSGLKWLFFLDNCPEDRYKWGEMGFFLLTLSACEQETKISQSRGQWKCSVLKSEELNHALPPP